MRLVSGLTFYIESAYLEVPGPGIHIIPKGPIVVEAMTNFLVDGAHGLHIRLPPLATKVLGLHFEQLEHVELHECMPNLQSFLQNRGRFEDD